MKRYKMQLLALALAGAAWTLAAQDAGTQAPSQPAPPQEGGPGGPPGPGGPRGPGGFHHRPPPCPVMMVLDANGDGILDEQEIANASAALRTLDKNGDGKLTPDELRPPLPPPGERPPGAPGFRPPPPDGNGNNSQTPPEKPSQP